MEAISEAIKRLVRESYDVDLEPEVTRPDPKFGDFATNAALILGKKLSQNPREIADKLAESVKSDLPELVSEVSVAGPGFLNIRLLDQYLLKSAQSATQKNLKFKDKVVVAEYSDPSAFKVLHAGHFYTSVVGDSVANLFENAGAIVHRVNFGGDVGLHVGKTMWAIIQKLGGENPDNLDEVLKGKRADWMSERYVEGERAYNDNESVKSDIIEINKKVYKAVDDDDHESPFARIYWTCRDWSYSYFDAFYARIGTKFEKYYPESITGPVGLRVVREQLAKGVYKESDGAVVFEGEPYGLHTRVFINSEGLPTYEAKDVGLITMKWDEYHYDKSFIITDHSQTSYLKVVLKSIEQFAPESAKRTMHIPHGMVKLRGAVKMSSRKGNIFRAVDVIESAKEANKKATGMDDEQSAISAVKYAFVKQRISPEDLIYDPEESVSLEGNSGPYLQYAHARACSILKKADYSDKELTENVLEPAERNLTLKISQYAEVVDKSLNELMPHHICTYLYELAQIFNSFYERNRVIGNERQELRLKLISNYKNVLKDGLNLLGIDAPEHM